MTGLPKQLSTKADWLNAVQHAKTTGEGKAVMRSRLLSLKLNSTILVLKKTSANKKSEDQTPEDYEAALDPGCEKVRLGFTDAEIDELTGGLT
ncbi:MAG: hypothetical protein LBP37_04145 [Spirochaetaceae bacterium]|jgi:hypothetical protein|nr:hypothetical protein [Spirochaetaceae bacterium]